jgi:cellulose biosynthesis protein BcsQ
MTRVLATYNIKGGVGKTSAAVNLATLAALGGARTLIWDLDPQGASTFLFRIRPKVKGGARKLVRGKTDVDAAIKGTDHEGLDLLPADFSYRHMDLALGEAKDPTGRLASILAPLAGDYDYTFLDCPPSISLVSESVFEAADALLVPIIPATLSSRTLEQLQSMLHAGSGGPRVLGFFSMADRRKKLHRELMDSLTLEHPDLLKTVIPSSAEVERMGLHRAALVDFAPRSRAARAYADLWEEVRARIAD